MKKVVLFLLVSICAFAVRAQTDLIARIHFLGGSRVAADPGFKSFTNIFCSPEALALRKQTLDKLARFPCEVLKAKMAAHSGDGVQQLRPLLDDLMESEWVLEIRQAPGGSPEYALAVRLNAARAQLWQNNLANLLEAWTRLPAKKIPNGWQLDKHDPPNIARFVHVGGWIVFDCAENRLPLGDEWVHQILKEKRPVTDLKGNWLELNVDWPRLAKIFPDLPKIEIPKTEMRVTGRGGDLRFNGKFTLAQPLPPLKKWRLPTNIIHEPFDSFTAARGFSSWLKQQPWAKWFDLSPPLNQIFIWALPGIPFQTFAAAPVSDSSTALTQLYKKIERPLGVDMPGALLTTFSPVLTTNEIVWHGVPFIAPFVQALREKSEDCLFGGFFPSTPSSQPLPPELFQQLNTPNLVYYHWEITAERLPQVLELSQLGLVLTQHKQLDAKSAAGKWLHLIMPKLGNTVTEITQTAPNELTFTRKAPAGLTAMELFAFASWLEAPNFPGCDLRLSPRPKPQFKPRPRPTKPVKILSAPATPATH